MVTLSQHSVRNRGPTASLYAMANSMLPKSLRPECRSCLYSASVGISPRSLARAARSATVGSATFMMHLRMRMTRLSFIGRSCTFVNRSTTRSWSTIPLFSRVCSAPATKQSAACRRIFITAMSSSSLHISVKSGSFSFGNHCVPRSGSSRRSVSTASTAVTTAGPAVALRRANPFTCFASVASTFVSAIACGVYSRISEDPSWPSTSTIAAPAASSSPLSLSSPPSMARVSRPTHASSSTGLAATPAASASVKKPRFPSATSSAAFIWNSACARSAPPGVAAVAFFAAAFLALDLPIGLASPVGQAPGGGGGGGCVFCFQ
eukprot:Rhum_TRINITY_DN15480_c1_g1::Rhum_TRINITY_DN15480_c1_g1_i1::g.158855::m.158855